MTERVSGVEPRGGWSESARRSRVFCGGFDRLNRRYGRERRYVRGRRYGRWYVRGQRYVRGRRYGRDRRRAVS